MASVPPWVVGAVVSVLGFVGAWAALRVTVAHIKEGLTEGLALLKQMLLTVTTLQATQIAQARDIERAVATGHENRNRMQELSERVARLEARAEGDES